MINIENIKIGDIVFNYRPVPFSLQPNRIWMKNPVKFKVKSFNKTYIQLEFLEIATSEESVTYKIGGNVSISIGEELEYYKLLEPAQIDIPDNFSRLSLIND